MGSRWAVPARKTPMKVVMHPRMKSGGCMSLMQSNSPVEHGHTRHGSSRVDSRALARDCASRLSRSGPGLTIDDSTRTNRGKRKRDVVRGYDLVVGEDGHRFLQVCSRPARHGQRSVIGQTERGGERAEGAVHRR